MRSLLVVRRSFVRGRRPGGSRSMGPTPGECLSSVRWFFMIPCFLAFWSLSLFLIFCFDRLNRVKHQRPLETRPLASDQHKNETRWSEVSWNVQRALKKRERPKPEDAFHPRGRRDAGEVSRLQPNLHGASTAAGSSSCGDTERRERERERKGE